MELTRSPVATAGGLTAGLNLVRDYRRPRKSKPKPSLSSSLSFRLNPDFDPKELIGSNGRNNVELDPKTIEFNELVNLLHSCFISDYLHKILIYLTSDSIELSFSSIEPYKEAFLLKIVQNNDYLKCSENFNESAKILAKQILTVIEVNKNVYKWMYVYENGVTNILVYRKLYNFRKSNSTNTQTCSTQSSVFKRPQPVSNTSNSLESSLEDLNLNTSDQAIVPMSFKLRTVNTAIKFIQHPHRTIFVFPDFPINEAEVSNTSNSLESSLEDLNLNTSDQAIVPMSFKLRTLNTAIKFIQHPHRTIFVFPDFPINEAEFVQGIINRNNNVPVGVELKSLYATLFESMERVETVFNIKTSYLRRGETSAQVCIEKVPKRTATQNNKPDHNMSLESNGSKDNRLNLTKDKLRKNEIVDSVHGDFIKDSLAAMLEFVRDNQRAGLEFNDCCPSEARFLESLTSFIRRQENYTLFSEDCAQLLQKIRTEKHDGWKLQMVFGKACKKSRKRTITFYKFPQGKQSVTKQPVYQHTAPNSLEVNKKESTTVSWRKDTNVPSITESNPVVKRSLSVDRDQSFRKPTAPISFHSSGNVPSLDRVARNKSSNHSLPTQSRQSRLIEGLSTPLESDKAERMMRIMGWEGGPLGQRGDGITEPIMPAIHLSPGAGLGHVKKVQRTPSEFTKALLLKMIELLQTNWGGVFVCYKDALTKKEAKFVGTLLEALNNRCSDGLTFSNEVLPLALKVLEELGKDDKVIIQAEISKDKKKIHLATKCSQNPLPVKKSKKKTQASSIVSETVPTNATKSLEVRISFLQTINEFLSAIDVEKTYFYTFKLAEEHKSFISDIVSMANTRDWKYNFDSSAVINIVSEIQTKAQYCYLNVTFYDETKKKFKLQKKFYKKRFRSLINLPPPTSKDAKNTVFYHNVNENRGDIEINSKHFDNNDSEDDVIIIENKQEVIIISDSEDEKVVKQSLDVTDGTIKLLPKPTKDAAKESIEGNVVTQQVMIDHSIETLVDITKQSINNTSNNNIVNMGEANSVESVNVMDYDDLRTIENNELFKTTIEETLSVLTEDVSETTKTVNSSINDMVTREKTDSETTTCHDVNSLVTPDKDNTEYIDCLNTSKDVSLNSISNESLLLDILETENESCSKVIKLENALDKDIIDLEQAILESDFNIDIKKEPNLDVIETKSIKTTIFTHLEINNNCDIDGKLKDLDKSQEISIRFSNEHDSIDFYDNSSNNSKRLRTNSDDSINSTKRYKVASKYHISVTTKSGEMNLETVKKVQKMISKEIADNSFMPLLKCHSIQNGRLIYGCHDEKTLQWLENIICDSNLDLITTEIEFSEGKNYKVMLKIFSSDCVEKNLKMISKYNEALKTENWVIRNVEFINDFQLITVLIDENSYNYISMYNFSLFAGVDMARFSIVWN